VRRARNRRSRPPAHTPAPRAHAVPGNIRLRRAHDRGLVPKLACRSTSCQIRARSHRRTATNRDPTHVCERAWMLAAATLTCPDRSRTELSRRRSRARVPSLPSLEVPANRHYLLLLRRSRRSATHIPHSAPGYSRRQPVEAAHGPVAPGGSRSGCTGEAGVHVCFLLRARRRLGGASPADLEGSLYVACAGGARVLDSRETPVRSGRVRRAAAGSPAHAARCPALWARSV
jgi:hypothetical protein